MNTLDEFNKRLSAQETVCDYHNVKMIVDEYSHTEYLDYIKGLENEPEKGLRCIKCIEFRLKKTAKKARELNINKFTTSLVISPHKNFKLISEIGLNISQDLEYVAIDFKKKNGFLETNRLSKELGIYRQNFCGCEFSMR